MHAFVFLRRPKSLQGSKKQQYKDGVLKDCKNYHPKPLGLAGPLYGLVYYFHKGPMDTDADNISKLIWDALIGHVYADDRVVKLRKAGVWSMANSIHSLDLTPIPDKVFNALTAAVGKEEHVVYVEMGDLTDKMFTFGQG